jgi:alanyl-tRNA synthetase
MAEESGLTWSIAPPSTAHDAGAAHQGEAGRQVEEDAARRPLGVRRVPCPLGETVFTGYDYLQTETRRSSDLIVDGVASTMPRREISPRSSSPRPRSMRSPAGQEADAGTIVGPGYELEVLDVQRPVKGLVSHRVQVVVGGGRASATRPPASSTRNGGVGQRRHIRRPTSCTRRLREVLGPDAHQSGSYNKAGFMRSTSAGTRRCRLRPGVRSRRSPTTRSGRTSRSRPDHAARRGQGARGDGPVR